MYLKSVHIWNFRLLEDIEVSFDKVLTLFVGKNNAGKTSFMHIMRQIINGKKNLSFADYPLKCREKLYEIICGYWNHEIKYEELLDMVPTTKIRFIIDYNDEREDELLGALSPFIIDLDEDKSEAIIEGEYQFIGNESILDELLKRYQIIYSNIKDERKDNIGNKDSKPVECAGEQKEETIEKEGNLKVESNQYEFEIDKKILAQIVEEEFDNVFSIVVRAINPTDEKDYQVKNIMLLRELFVLKTIDAERGLDESENSPLKPLGTIMNRIFENDLKEVKSSLYEKSKTGDFVEVCQDMNIVSTLPEYIKPKNVGLMFFSMEPDKFFPYTQIDVVQFPSGLGGNDIIEKTFKGPIHQQLRDALQYIKNVIITEKVVKHPDRAEADRFFNFPYAAVEEALSNAVYHRAYDEREPIEVRVENDRIEIVSFPGPDRSVTIEGLKSYRVSNRRYRNRRIGDFLKELHLTEGRNTGFKKILDALEANGSPKPEFETDEDRSYFITRLFIHESFVKDVNERKMSDKMSDKLSDKEKKFIDIMIEQFKRNDYITTAIMVNASGMPISTVRRYMTKLCEMNIVYSEGKNKGTKYYLM